VDRKKGKREIYTLEELPSWTRDFEVEKWLHLEVWRSDGELELLMNPVFANRSQSIPEEFRTR